MKIATNHTWHNIRQYEKKIHLTSKICADPQLFFLLINPQYMYGIRVNSSAVDSPNNSLIKTERKTRSQKMGGGGGGDYKLHLQDMREGKLCPETLST